MTLRRLFILFSAVIALAPAAFAIAPPSADVSVSKSGPSTVVRGGIVTYTISVSNAGPDPALTVQLDDPLPPGITFASESQNSGPSFSCSNPPVGTNGTITCTIASLSVNATAVFTIVGNVPSSAPGGTTYDNTATVSTTTPDPGGTNNSSMTTATVQAVSDLSVTKTGPDNAADDTDVVYDILVVNNGPEDAQGITLKDFMPSGMTFVSLTQNSGPTFDCSIQPSPGTSGPITCTNNTLAVGASADFTLTLHITPIAPPGTIFTNTATVSSPSDPNEEDNSSSATTIIPSPEADLVVQKSGPSSALPDTDVVYSVTLINNGGSAASTVSLTDTLPGTMTFVGLTQNSGPAFDCSSQPAPGSGGTITCTILSLASGASATFTFTVHIPAGTAPGTSFENVVNVTSSTPDPNPTSNQARTTVVVSTTDLAITKTGPGTANAGGTISWTITVTNNGPDTELNAVFSDSLPAGTTFNSLTQNTGTTASCTNPGFGNAGTVSCSFPPMASTESATFTLVANINPSFTGLLNNTATVNGSNADPNSNNNSATAPATVTTSADLTINKTGPSTANAGTDITYTITLTNAGPSNAANVSLTDAVPANTTFVAESQTAGQVFSCTKPAVGGTGNVNCTIASFGIGSATFSMTVHISPGAAGATITNTAGVTSSTTDPNPAGNSPTVNTTVTRSADISVLKTAPAGANAGTQITYNITVTNNGPSDSATVTMSDLLPPNTTFVSETQPTGPAFICTNPPSGGTGTVSCSIATLTNGTTATFTITVLISPAAPTGPSSNTATVTSTSDPNSGNDNSTAVTQIGPALSDLSITKTPSPGPYGTGSLVTYTIVVTNLGPNTATAVTVTDVLPPNTTFVAATPGGACTVNTTTLTCTFPTLANGATATVTLSLRPTVPGPVVNTATVSASALNPDPNPGNNTATSTINVIPAANIPMVSPLALLILCIALAIAGAFVQRT